MGLPPSATLFQVVLESHVVFKNWMKLSWDICNQRWKNQWKSWFLPFFKWYIYTKWSNLLCKILGDLPNTSDDLQGASNYLLRASDDLLEASRDPPEASDYLLEAPSSLPEASSDLPEAQSGLQEASSDLPWPQVTSQRSQVTSLRLPMTYQGPQITFWKPIIENHDFSRFWSGTFTQYDQICHVKYRVTFQTPQYDLLEA